VLAAIGVAVIIGVCAELASQFREAGGAYLYAREAFGRFWGVQMGWFGWLVRLTAAAANANLFVTYLGEFWPGVTAPLSRALILAALLGTLTFINLRGVSAGGRTSNFFTFAKLLPLALLIVGGLALGPVVAPAGPATAPVIASDWVGALLVLMFTFGGFDMTLMPAAEYKDPERDLPFALFTGLGIITAFYVLLQIVAMRTVPDLAHSERPLADAARSFAGPAGAALMALGAMVSTAGYLSAQLVGVPRLTYALAVNGDFPRWLGAVHPKFRTPHVSIIAWGILTLALALYGNFIWNVSLSAAARLLTYGASCVALIRLRRLRPAAAAWRLPLGVPLALAGLALCFVMATAMDTSHAWIIAAVAMVAAVNWGLVRKIPRG
jgi:amino acid transporter